MSVYNYVVAIYDRENTVLSLRYNVCLGVWFVFGGVVWCHDDVGHIIHNRWRSVAAGQLPEAVIAGSGCPQDGRSVACNKQ